MKNLLQAAISVLIGLTLGGLLLLLTSQPRGTAIQLLPPPTPAPLVVHIDGAVAAPGVYHLPPGSRLEQAIQAAGGLASGANLASINLAARVRDGQKISIPFTGQAESPPDQAAPAAETGAIQYPLDLNTATLEELDSLPGIGPAIAQDILDYRESIGDFKTIDELKDVPGIGDTKFDQIKDLVFVESAP